MLATQVQYWQYKENQRHNIAYEKLTDFQNREQQRHNLETETQGRISLNETVRHNKATELLGRDTLTETIRHNKVGERETQRHNKVTESETKRHNKATEKFSYDSLAETTRHNLASEKLTLQNINLGYANLSESSRHNKVNEAIQRASVRIASDKSVYEMQNLASQTGYTTAQTIATHEGIAKIRNEAELTGQKAKYYPLEMGAEAFSDISKGVFNLTRSGEILSKLFKSESQNTSSNNNFWNKVSGEINNLYN